MQDNHTTPSRWFIDKDGYIVLVFAGGKKKPEHRHLMELHLGRALTPNEVVHHRNEEKMDNRIENLQVMTRAEHASYHGKMTRWSHDYDCCVVCHTTERKHDGHGLCTACRAYAAYTPQVGRTRRRVV